MISFFICLALLIGGYFVYGKVVENTFAPDDRETPAVRINDGVDYVVMPEWKLFLVQLLNIAGLGPIFGAMQVLSGDRLYFYGSRLVPSLQEVYMIIFPVCFPNVMMVLPFQRYVVFTLEM